ncbi:hypothetical protein CH063_09177 [Colletotrichum higginsianum]|uniref:Methyltransferase n=1 Tax=Colletotrichum higginsianum (strain IMI 349063) TaxID=759273 RepID=H1VCL4_COLHI|nr:hypothetical protein CH063_09177 [Colletotrichum higginsianum]
MDREPGVQIHDERVEHQAHEEQHNFLIQGEIGVGIVLGLGGVDSKERSRLDLQQPIALRIFDNEPGRASVSKPHRVLDIGTGMGIRATDPEYVPTNCRFEIEDAEDKRAVEQQLRKFAMPSSHLGPGQELEDAGRDADNGQAREGAGHHEEDLHAGAGLVARGNGAVVRGGEEGHGGQEHSGVHHNVILPRRGGVVWIDKLG